MTPAPAVDKYLANSLIERGSAKVRVLVVVVRILVVVVVVVVRILVVIVVVNNNCLFNLVIMEQRVVPHILVVRECVILPAAVEEVTEVSVEGLPIRRASSLLVLWLRCLCVSLKHSALDVGYKVAPPHGASCGSRITS